MLPFHRVIVGLGLTGVVVLASEQSNLQKWFSKTAQEAASVFVMKDTSKDQDTLNVRT